MDHVTFHCKSKRITAPFRKTQSVNSVQPDPLSQLIAGSYGISLGKLKIKFLLLRISADDPSRASQILEPLENSVFVKPAYLHVVTFAMCVIKLRSEDLSHNNSRERSKLYTLYDGKIWL